jgi:hypothetical protein
VSDRRSKIERRIAAQQTPARGGRSTLIAQHTEERTEITTNPIPDAGELQRLKDLDPDLYDLVKQEYKANGAHRRDIEKCDSQDRRMFLKAVTLNERLGMAFSWSFALICVGVGVYFTLRGYREMAIIGILGVLPPVIGMFRRVTGSEKGNGKGRD